MSQTISRMFGVFAILSLALSIGALSLAATRSGTLGPSGAAGLPGTNGGQGPAGQTGPAGPQGSQGPPGTSWKTGSYSSCAVNGAKGTVKNCASITFTAPQDGFIWLQSSGYCHTPQGALSYQLQIGWSTSSSTAPQPPSAVYVSHIANEPTGTSQESYAASAVTPVTSGSNTYYLNALYFLYDSSGNPTSGSASFLCFGTNILMFTTTQLS